MTHPAASSRISMTPEGASKTVFERNPALLITGALTAAVFLVFQPFGLNQFLLPKFLVLLLGLPGLLFLEINSRLAGESRYGDPLLSRLALLFFISSILLPLLHTANPTLAALGIIEALTMYLLFRAAAGIGSRGAKTRHKFLLLITLPLIPIGALALVQGLGLDPLAIFAGLQSTRSGRWQMLSTLGHPSWTAELLVLLLPPALALLRSSPGAARTVAVLISCVVILSGSRGSMLVLGLLLWICFRYELLSLPPRPWKNPFLLLAAGLTVVAFILLIRSEPGRLLSWTPLSGRLGLWAAGLHIAAIHPLTGSGLHHSNLLLPEGLRAVVASADPRWISGLPTVLVDRLDNDLLQITVERGLVSLVILLWFFSRCLRRVRSGLFEQTDPGQAAILASLSGLALFSLFSSPLQTPSTTVIFWVFAGLAASGTPKECSDVAPNRPRFPRILPVLIPLSAALLSIALATYIVIPALGINDIAGRAHRLLRRGDFSRAAEILAPISAKAPWLPEAAIDRARALVVLHRPEEALAELAPTEEWIASEWIWTTRARALQELGLHREARKQLQDGLGILPRSPVLLEAGSSGLGAVRRQAPSGPGRNVGDERE